MRVVLIGSPAGAFAFGINASQFRAVSGGPSTGRATPKRTPVAPPLLPQRSALRLLGDVCAGTRPTEWCFSVAWSTLSNGTFVLLPVGTIYHGTPKHDAVGKVLGTHSRTRGSNRQGERAIHPLAEAKGLAGPLSVNGSCLRSPLTLG